MKQILFSFLILQILVCCSPTKAQTSGGDSINYKPIGKLIDIGGYKLHLHGTGNGSPSVILISGASNFSFDWTLVQDKLPKSIKVCSYDRPGLAWSDPGPMPRSIMQDVYELHELLNASKMHPPFILVGHSIGGIIARMYARQYSDDIAGMVLVDATSENAILNVNGKIERLRLLASAGKKIPSVKRTIDTLTKIPSTKEVEELWNMFGKPSISFPFNKLPANIQKIRLWAQSLPKYQIADADDYIPEEFKTMYADSQSYKIGDKPLMILYSSKNEYPKELGTLRDSLMNDKIGNQHAFLRLSTNSKIIRTANSGHEIFLTEPDLVVSAIKQVIGSIRTKHKLK